MTVVCEVLLSQSFLFITHLCQQNLKRACVNLDKNVHFLSIIMIIHYLLSEEKHKGVQVVFGRGLQYNLIPQITNTYYPVDIKIV